MMAERRCPYCGASENANWPRLTFECGSGGSCESSVIRAAPCYCREINGLKAENERLKDQIHQLQYLVAAAKLEITGKEIVVEQANAKVAELQRHKDELMLLLGYVATARRANTKDWMEGFVERFNECLEAIGDEDRIEWSERHDVIKVLSGVGKKKEGAQ